MAVLLLAMLIAARASAVPVALLAGSLLVLGLIARLWSTFGLAGVVYERWASPRRAFCGDFVLLETSLSNRKLLPLPWVEVWEKLPMVLDPGSDTERSLEDPSHVWLCQGASLWPYQRARWRHRLHCRRRGVFTLRDARVRTGDPFGLCEREARLEQALELVVYPRVVPLRRLALSFHHPSTDAASPQSLILDPTRTIGSREYRPGDPQRLIHWPATAHQGGLHVRVLERASNLQVCLVLDAGSFEHRWDHRGDDLFELALTALASIAVYLSEAGHPVGFLTDASPPAHLLPGAGPGHLESILESMARIRPGRSPRAEEWSAAYLPPGTSVVVGSSDVGWEMPARVSRLEQAGHQVTLVLVGKESSARPWPARGVRIAPGQDLAAALEGEA